MTAIEILVYGIEGFAALVVIRFAYKSFKKTTQAAKEMREMRADLKRGYPSSPSNPYYDAPYFRKLREMTPEERNLEIERHNQILRESGLPMIFFGDD